MVVYVSGPYSAPTEEDRLENVGAAIDAGYRLLEAGHAPLIPHLNHFFDERVELYGGVNYEQYMAWSLEFLARCDAMLFLGSSPGADTERVFAECHGIPVYESLEQVPPADAAKVAR